MSESYSTTVSSWVFAIYQALNKQGIDGEVILSKCHLAIDDIQETNPRFALKQVRQLWMASVAATGNDAFGLQVVDYLDEKALNALTAAILVSKNIREAIQRLLRYYQAVSSGFTLVVHEEEHLVLEFQNTPSGEFIAPEAVDAAFGIMVRDVRKLTDAKINPTIIELTKSVPKQALEYTQFFQCPVHFNAKRNAISFPSLILDLEIPNANERLAAHLEQYLSDVLKTLDEQELSRKIYINLMQMLPSGAPTIVELAGRMHMSERSLQRKLKEENTGFTEILSNLRMDLATRYLKEQKYQISEISYLLGFSSPSNFVRFFKNQTGYPPSQYLESQ